MIDRVTETESVSWSLLTQEEAPPGTKELHQGYSY